MGLGWIVASLAPPFALVVILFLYFSSFQTYPATTGATVWRMLKCCPGLAFGAPTQWLGGMGIMVLFIA